MKSGRDEEYMGFIYSLDTPYTVNGRDAWLSGGMKLAADYGGAHPHKEAVKKIIELALEAYDTERYGETDEEKLDWVFNKLKEYESKDCHRVEPNG